MNSRQQRKRASLLLKQAVRLERNTDSTTTSALHLELAAAASVCLVAWLQAYVRELVDRSIDGFSEDWEHLSRVQKAIVVRQVKLDLDKATEGLANEVFPAERKLERFADNTKRAIEIFASPKSISPSSSALLSADILRSNGTGELARVVDALKGTGGSFRDWVGNTYKARSQLAAELDGLIDYRHDVAHGLGRRTATVREVRIYAIRVRQAIWLINRYLQT